MLFKLHKPETNLHARLLWITIRLADSHVIRAGTLQQPVSYGIPSPRRPLSRDRQVRASSLMPRGAKGEKRPTARPHSGSLLVLPPLGLLISACAVAPAATHAPLNPSADEALAIQSRVTDCERKAADQYDDGRYAVSELAERVMGACAVELTKAALAFGFSPIDPKIALDQYKQAVRNVEAARQARTKKPPNKSN
jgi:hypothetical protein